MKKLESSFTNMVLVLTIISLVASGGLAFMHQITAGPIAAAEKKSQEEAIRMVLPDFAQLDTAIVVNDNKVFRAYDANGSTVGMAVETVSKGFGGDMTVMVGIKADGTIYEYKLLKHAETPGLGDKAATWFKEKSDIRGLSDNNGALTVSKDGGSVDAITAATISSRAFLNTINSALTTYHSVMSVPAEYDSVSGATPQSGYEAATDSINTDSTNTESTDNYELL